MAATLAQKQLERAGALSLDALMVYLDVLQAQGRYDEALAVVEGPGGQQVQLPQDKLRLRVRVLPALLVHRALRNPVWVSANQSSNMEHRLSSNDFTRTQFDVFYVNVRYNKVSVHVLEFQRLAVYSGSP
jgi:hypothetical protein